MPNIQKSSIEGPFLTIDNIDTFAGRLPEKDQHLIRPSEDIEKPLLLDIFAILKQYRNKDEAERLFSLLFEENINNDRVQRVSLLNSQLDVV